MPRHWLTIAIVVALFAGGLLLLDSSPEVLQPGDPMAERDEALLTAYLTGVDTTQYSQSGSIEYNFAAERMSHFQADPESASEADFTTIESPDFTFYQAEASPWYVRAERGRSIQNGDVIVLRDDVRVWQENEASEPTVITTSELLIRPDSQVAETDQFVIISYPRIVTRGVGMRANLAEETFTILSEGSTSYEPNR